MLIPADVSSSQSPVQASWVPGSTTGVTRLGNPSSTQFEGEIENTSFSAALNTNWARGIDSKIYYNFYERENSSNHIVFTPSGPGSGGACDFNPVTGFYFIEALGRLKAEIDPSPVLAAKIQFGRESTAPGHEPGSPQAGLRPARAVGGKSPSAAYSSSPPIACFARNAAASSVVSMAMPRSLQQRVRQSVFADSSEVA